MASKYCDRADVCKMRGWCATDFNQENGCEFFEPETNADRIRAKDTERLAEFLNRVETDGRCGNLRGKNGWLDWLRSPAEVKK